MLLIINFKTLINMFILKHILAIVHVSLIIEVRLNYIFKRMSCAALS